MKILVRATNWSGDAVMSLPALAAIRANFPTAEIAVLARPWVADIYVRQTAIDRVISYRVARGARDLGAKWDLGKQLRNEAFDCAILLQNAFEAALLVRLAGIPRRIGYDRDGRGWLLTDPIAGPKPSEIPRPQSFYYLGVLRRGQALDVGRVRGNRQSYCAAGIRFGGAIRFGVRAAALRRHRRIDKGSRRSSRQS